MQFGAGVGTVIYTAVVTFVLLKITGAIVPLRVDAGDESQGLDLVLHDESGYRL